MTRRDLLRKGSGAAFGLYRGALVGKTLPSERLTQLRYDQVRLAPGPLARQLRENHEFLLNLSEDSLLRPFRVREGLPAPGRDLGGWYDTYAFAPGATYGQWLSALARFYAISGDEATRGKVGRMVRGYGATISSTGRFYVENRFPSYIHDKLVLGLVDASTLAHDPAAIHTLVRATDAALPYLPPRAMARQETQVQAREDFTRHCWDESYTNPENLFLAQALTGAARYGELAKRFLYDAEFFDPLSRGENVLPGKHAYSHVNALSSAAKAYLALHEPKYLQAARNGFAMVQEQSYATGGWGPDEHFFKPGSGKLGETLSSTHSSFETPCGAYAHFKITRYLLRITKDSRYGDSMERVLYNTVQGATPIQPNGSAFYYADYNFDGRKTVHPDKWPCCSGTLPQVAADYGISSYFEDSRGIYVNLYVPSTVAWTSREARYELRQTTAYPYESHVRLDVTASSPGTFSLFLRIPEWAEGASLTVNGERDSRKAKSGTFAEVHREWKTGDRIDLDLPLKSRVEPVDRQHPGIVALLWGPLVLMGVGKPPGRITQASLLQAKRTNGSSRLWKTETSAGEVSLTSFPEIRGESYSAYFKV